MYKGFIYFLLIVTLFTSQLVYAEKNTTYYSVDIYKYLQKYSFDLLEFSLELPEYSIKPFSLEGREKLLNLATLFSNNKSTSLSSYNLNDESRELMMPLNEEDIKTLDFNPIPGMILKTNYDQVKEDKQIETTTNISLEYRVNSRTSIRAEYDLLNKEWFDITKIAIDNSIEQGNIEGENEGIVIDYQEPGEGGVFEELILNEEKSQQSRLGISYQTSDKITISADYIDDDFCFKSDNYSTVIGLEYDDELNKLRAEYQIDYLDEFKQTVTGLKLDLKEMGTLSASYKLLTPDQLTEELEQSVWDFGLDFNLSELSSISIGYQLIDNIDESEQNVGFETEDKESNITAQFEIKF
jgi:hypothetical protein